MSIRTVAARLVVCFIALLSLPLSASAQAVLSVTPTSLSFQGAAGTAAPSNSLSISNAGTKALNWSVSPNMPGLTASPASGVNRGTVTVGMNIPAGLALGTYVGSVRVSAAGGTTVTVPVTLTVVTAVGPALPPPPPPPTTLVVTCPANMSVSSTGSAVPVLYNATTTGGAAPVTLTYNPASGTSFPVGTTSVSVTARSSDGQTANCSFSVTVTTSSTITFTGLTISGPGTATVGQTLQYTATARYSDGSSWNVTNNTGWLTSSNSVATITLAGALSALTAGTVNVQASYGGVNATPLAVSVTGATAPPPPPPPSASAVGPQSTITCPAGAVDIFPGTSIQNYVNLYPGTTTFCLKAGTHSITSAIRPKTGNTFVGEYGAIVDGTGWSTSDGTQAAFRAHNEDIDYVTIRNLVIRNMPQRGIHAYYWMSDHWTIEYNEIAFNANIGIVFPGTSMIRNNYIHHNPYSGYMGNYADYSTLDSNEIAYNGREQKIGESANVTFRNNFVHHNAGNGIWYDGSNIGAVIEDNRLEDNGGSAIHYEISSDVIIRNNIIRRSGEIGVFISTSKNAQIFNNTLENNFRGILYFVSCFAVGGSSMGFDLTNTTAHDNTITVGTQAGALATALAYTVDCTSAQLAPYLNGSKNTTFSHNTYRVPSPATVQYWLWSTFMYWNQWQAIPQDATSTVSQ